jgi:hypothetical protein
MHCRTKSTLKRIIRSSRVRSFNPENQMSTTPQSPTQGDVFLNFNFARPQQRSSWLTQPDRFVLRNFEIDGQDRDGIFALKTKFFSDSAHEGIPPTISVERKEQDASVRKFLQWLDNWQSMLHNAGEERSKSSKHSRDFRELLIQSKKFLKDQPQNELRIDELWIACVRHILLSEKDFEDLNDKIRALIEEIRGCTNTNKERRNEDEKMKKLKESFEKLCQEVAHEQLCFAFKLIDIVAPILQARVWLDLKGDSFLAVFERADYKKQHIENICKLTCMQHACSNVFLFVTFGRPHFLRRHEKERKI